ncbi:ribonuclease HII [Patescibacteria group bacterium]
MVAALPWYNTVRTDMFNRPHTKYEKRLLKEGYQAVVGLDEVGRGAWAGPIVAGAAIMPHRPRLYNVRDSKVLSPKKRDELAERIKERAQCWAIGVVPHYEIDEVGIVRANELAMLRAVENLTLQPDYILIDAFKIVGLPAKYSAVAHGDAMIYSIAAASIVAKVERDRMMTEYDEQFPYYGFGSNKGYGTDAHKISLDQYGVCDIHRRSFHPMKTMV